MDTTSLRSTVVRNTIEAINQGKINNFMALFASDAILVDGRTYTGLAAIRDWAQRETFGVQLHFQLESEQNEQGTAIQGQVVSTGGYNGPATFTFNIRNNTIERLVID